MGESGIRSDFSPEYIKHCIRSAPEIAKLGIPNLAETFVAIECNYAPWTAFWYYGLISDEHYMIVGKQRAKNRVKEGFKLDWGELGFPHLTPKGYHRFKLRRDLISTMLGQRELLRERTREHRAEAYLAVSRHIVNDCRASIVSRKRWHSNVFQAALRHRPFSKPCELPYSEQLQRLRVFLAGVNAGDGPDGIAASAIGRWCFGTPSPQWHRPCILCAYPLPFAVINGGLEHNRNGANQGCGDG